MPTMSYAAKISRLEVMLSGLENNVEKVSKRGLNEAFIKTMAESTAKAIQLNNEQEKLKAALKSKTVELEAKLAELSKTYSEAKKVVKMDFPQSQWKEFGIEDKK